MLAVKVYSTIYIPEGLPFPNADKSAQEILRLVLYDSLPFFQSYLLSSEKMHLKKLIQDIHSLSQLNKV